MGKRSVTYTKVENGIKVVIKKERRGVQAKNFLQNEAKWLKILNKKGIGPKFVRSGKNCLVYRYVEGERILDWMENAEKEEIKR
ncbi:hypothetical protein HY643_01470, partial [Candidatus Woesearchaeota archaeon]|nr:hypothetical protein [Candidatus Woesearchaeota archaeon]